MRAKTSGVQPAAKVFGGTGRKPEARRQTGIRPSLFYLTFGALAATNVLTLVGLLMAPEISGLLNRQNEDVVAAYEGRIAQLRIEVDRLHSRSFAQTGDINLQLQELSAQQEVLLEQQQLVKQLAEKAAALGIETAALPADDEADVATPVAAVTAKAPGDLAEVSQNMEQMLGESRLALAALSKTATQSTDTILTELEGLGIRPRMPNGPEAVGGPYQPATDTPEPDSIVDDANGVYLALARFRVARDAIDLAPIFKPLSVLGRVSSGFGNRSDPFTGGRAFHSGIDYPAPRGTTVLSAGAGKVTFVGQRAGYGNLVEVTHATGLVTRYGHLSSFLAKEGQLVNAGTPIAKVGSTGRSTGPHLHFEVRRKDVAVDPGKYLAAGRRLMRFLGA